MAFTFASFPSLMTTIHIPLRNGHFRDLKNPIVKPSIIIPSCRIICRSLPLKHQNKYEFHNGFSGETIITPCKVKTILKDMVREIKDCWESLEMIDALQRLGIEYHLQEEIDAILQSHHAIISDLHFHEEIDLHKVALRFRLLRQQGYYVPTDVFEIFMDKKGNFEEELRQDIKGLTSLYEASKLCMHGEEAILEKAENFTKQNLHPIASNPNHHLSQFVSHTLAHPIHRNPSKFMVQNYFGDIQCMNKWISILQHVAKVEFNATQALHQKEFDQFCQWWKGTGLGNECNFARHQPVAWYAFSLAFFTNPCFSEERILLAKSISFIYIVDDIFDEYGTLDQLSIFTEAVSRWNMSKAEDLPYCMKLCLSVLYETTNEITNKVIQKHGHNPTQPLRQARVELCRSFLVEAKWFKTGHWPKANEYLNNGIVSCGVPMGMVHAFFLLGQGLTHQTLDLQTSSHIVSSSALIMRLFNDIETTKGEGKDGHDGSYAECYMKEHQGISIETTNEHIENLILHAWKTLNRTCLLPNNPFAAKFIQASLNIARIFHLTFHSKSNHSSLYVKRLIKSVLFQNVNDIENMI